MATAEVIDDEVVELKVTEGKDAELAKLLVRRAVEIHVAEKREDRLSWLLSHPSLTEEVITQLVESDPAILPELGHQSGPRKLLEFLADKYRYPEAILTLAKDLYTSCESSAPEFQAFLAKHVDNEWLLKSLARLDASMPDKEEALVAVLRNHPEACDVYLGRQRSRQLQKRALEAASDESMRELFESGDPAAFRGLALNPRTPEPILRDLARTHGMKGAPEIRELANQALRRFSKKS